MKEKRKNVQDVKKKEQTNKGITLIALVITIIVLLILAAVSIATLTGQNGILTQAEKAKTETTRAEAKEKVQVEVLGSYGQDGNLDYSKLKTNLNHITGITGVPDTITASSFPLKVNVDGYEVTINSDGSVTVVGEMPTPPNPPTAGLQPGEKATSTVKDNYTDANKDKATVPAGFTVSQIPTETTIQNGLVIYDIPEGTTVDWTTKNADGAYQVQTLYNQFVWIPVATSASYIRDFSYPSYYDSDMETTPEGSTFTDTGYLPEGIQPQTDTAEANEQAERESVSKYQGFYIARYEAGQENSTTLVSKQSATVWNNITQTNSKSTTKTMYHNENDSVKSALCSGIQWDMVMKFVDGKNDAKNNPYNVRVGDSNRHTGGLASTGKNEYDKVQNIYDLEGNCVEWVAEKNNTSSPFVYRGRRLWLQQRRQGQRTL